MLIRSFVVVGLVGLSLAFNVATAEDAGTRTQNMSAITGVSFTDIGDHSPTPNPNSLHLSIANPSTLRYPAAEFTSNPQAPASPSTQQVEMALTSNQIAGSPVDIAVTQRASVGFNAEGDLESHGQGHEVRIGHRLGQRLGVSEWRGGTASWDNPTWYLFAASDDQAISLRGGHLTLQDYVEVGDLQAGITMERGPLRASFAYVEREISLQMGRKTSHADQQFTGVTISWRH